MSGDGSPLDFEFSDDDVRRPRRAAMANRQMFVESGTDDDEPSAGSKRRQKKGASKKPAKRAKRATASSDSDDDAERDNLNLTEKERELQIFKHMEQQELLRTREEIQQKLMGGDVVEEKPKKKKEPAVSMSDAVPVKPEMVDKESGEESSSDEEAQRHRAKKRHSPVASRAVEKEDESSESEVELDPTYHRPSEIAKKMDKKQAIADLMKSRKEKRQNEERKREQVLDVDKIFGHSKAERSDDSDDSSSSESSASDSEDSDNEAEDSKTQQGEEVSSFEQLNRIRLSRFKLAKLCHAPFFDRTVIGCFVRINVGQSDGRPVYRAAQVVGVVESHKTYDVEGTRTNKALRLKHGPDERPWRLEFVSNSPITNNEYFKWRDAMKRNKLPLPTTDYIEKKHDDIVGALNYQFTDADVKKMVEQRQKFVNVPTNHAVHKAELMKMKLDADQSGDTLRSNELQREIDEVDEIIKRKEMERCQDSLGISFINQRNREAQMKALAEKGRRNSDANKDDDPFTRKSGKMRVVSGSRKKGEEPLDSTTASEAKPQAAKPGDKKPPASSMHHSKSAPSLAIDEDLIFGDIPSAKPVVPQPAVNNSQGASSSAAPRLGGGISFAEFKRRKAEAAAATGK